MLRHNIRTEIGFNVNEMYIYFFNNTFKSLIIDVRRFVFGSFFKTNSR